MPGKRSSVGYFEKGERAFETFLKVTGWKSEYRSVQKLLNHLTRRTKSEGTKESYLSWLFRFCMRVGKNPDEIVAMKPSWLKDNVQDFVDEVGQKRGETGNLARASLTAFLKSNGFDGSERKAIQVKGFFSPARRTIEMADYIPSKDEIQRMANSGRMNNNRDRAIILVLHSSGLRQGTLRAVRYKDIKTEFEAQTVPLKIPVYPEMKEVLADACKGSVPYYTFINGEAVDALRIYLKELESKVETLQDGDVIFNGWSRNSSLSTRHRPLSRSSVDLLVKSAAQRAGIERWKDVHPHCLRKAFESVLREDTSDGRKLDTKTQEFLMGHILPGSQENYYDRSKVDWVRGEYSKLSFVSTRALDEKTVLATFNHRTLKMFGYTDDEISSYDLTTMTEEKLQELIDARRKQAIPFGGHQAVVEVRDVKRLLEHGWRFVASLPGGQAVLNPPEGNFDVMTRPSSVSPN